MLQASTFSGPHLFFMRHGEITEPERVDGWMPWGLSPKGFGQALLAADKLKPYGLPVVIASDLKRTLQTGEVVARATGARLVKEAGLRAWNTGILTNQLVAVAKPILEYYIDNPECIIPGGESYRQLCDRGTAAIGRAAEVSIRTKKPVLAVTSRSILGMLDQTLAGRPDGGAYMEVRSLPGGTIMHAFVRGGQWRIEAL